MFLVVSTTSDVHEQVKDFVAMLVEKIRKVVASRSRTDRIVQSCTLLLVAWIVMTTTHEVGHLIGGWLGGATLKEFDLTPWRLPYSIHQPDPRPLFDALVGTDFWGRVSYAVRMVDERTPHQIRGGLLLVSQRMLSGAGMVQW